MKLVCITKPTLEPIDITMVEGQTRIDDLSDEINTIEIFIQAVRERAEQITRRSLVTQVWELTLDGFPSGTTSIELPLPPLQSIQSIKYIDTNNVEQTLASTSYRVLLSGDPGRVRPINGGVWPTAIADEDVVTIQFTCGYGPIAPDEANLNIPKAIIQWQLINIANLYENRESLGVAMGRSTIFNLDATLCDGLLESHRMPRL